MPRNKIIYFGLKTRIISSFFLIIVIMSVAIGIYSYYQISTNVIDRAQKQLRFQLWTARSVYENEIDRLKHSFELFENAGNPAKLKNTLSLDYFYVVEIEAKDSIKSPIAAQAFLGNANGGTRIIGSSELISMKNGLFQKSSIDIKKTPMARPDNRTTLDSAMAIEYATPIFDSAGKVKRVIYGGKIINRDPTIIERMHRIVFAGEASNGKTIGTITIFQDSVRIATNVPDKYGNPAIGTQVSAIVYHNVVIKGDPWYSRAFVVTDWYLTAYEPIRDTTGNVIGILYVGTPEEPFNDMIRSGFFVFLLIILVITLVATIITFSLAAAISRPITKIVNASKTIAGGDLSHRVKTYAKVQELHELADSFNEMADKLHARETSLQGKNEELAILNKRYLDLVGMVAHELKGILSSTVINACSVRDGYYGPINEIQAKALESVTRNLEYFDQTVKNFLNLSRFERGKMELIKTEVAIKVDLVDESLKYFSRQISDRGMVAENNVDPDTTLTADHFLLLMVVNNLIGNAVKYGKEKSRIVISGGKKDNAVYLDVYSEGRPISEIDQEKLFKRFSRLETSNEDKKVHGTGLGLFISYQIVERHGGTIYCCRRSSGNSFIFSIPIQ